MSGNEISEKIEQLVFDENKVVTYKLLSSELNMHVNKAKQLLNKYITDHCAKKKNELNVYYAVSGFQKYNGHQIHKLAVVSKDELEKIKKKFSAVSSIHIYSIQKCSLLDDCSLYASDHLLAKVSDDPSVFSAIKHPDLKIRENKVIKNAAGANKEKNEICEWQATRKTEQKSSVPAKKINSLFTTWQEKDDVKNEQKDKNVKEQNDLPPAVSKNDGVIAEKKNSGNTQKIPRVADKGKNNIMNLFSRQAVKSTSKASAQSRNSEKSATQNIAPCEKDEVEKAAKRTGEKEKEVKAKQAETASEKKEIVQKKRKKHQQFHDSSENDSDNDWKKPKKKHKRIVAAFSDSDSESEEEEKKDEAQRNLIDSKSPAKVECNIIEEDEEEPIPPTLSIPVSNGKHKKLKVVSKSFEDEDGFLVTQKVKEYITDSEGSDNEAPATQSKAVPKSVPEHNIKQNFVNRKQASLMSFFKQK